MFVNVKKTINPGNGINAIVNAGPVVVMITKRMRSMKPVVMECIHLTTVPDSTNAPMVISTKTSTALMDFYSTVNIVTGPIM